MNKIFVAAAIAGITGCAAERNVQVQVVSAELVKIDTVYRHPNNEKELTWQCSNRVTYISYDHISRHYLLGQRITVLLQR